jgi:two-component system, NarL family, sensor kinase
VKRRDDSATRFVIAIIVVGFLALLVVLASGVVVIRQHGERHAIGEARSLTQLDAERVQSKITDAMVSGTDPRSRRQLADLIEQIVQPNPAGPVVRVKIWKVQGGVGEIIYSDARPLIGMRDPLWSEQLEALQEGGAVAELSDLDRDEHRYEAGLGPLTEVYTRIETPGGRPLLFETYQSTTAIASTGREIAGRFTPVLVVTLLVTVAVEVGLASALIRRFRRVMREREELMEAAVEASFRERRIIAGDLHDGPVQEVAGLCLGLAAEAGAARDPHTRDVLATAAERARSSVRTLRAAIVGVYPPNLEQMGLEAALSDLLARLPAQEITAHFDYDLDSDVEHRTSELLYRASQEAIRNVEKHAKASNVWVTVQRRNGEVTLCVQDDGRGGARLDGQVQPSGRFGLAVLADILRDAGGALQVSSDTTGTTVRVRTPV